MKSHRMKIASFIDRCFLFHLTCFCLVTFPRSLVQTFRSDRSTYLKNIFFHSFYTFEVMTHFVAEKTFLNKYLATLFGYNSWGLNTFKFQILRWIPNIHLPHNELWKSIHLKAMQKKCLQNKISIPLCWPIDLETLKVFSLCLQVASKPAAYKNKFSGKNFPTTTRLWSKISYGDEKNSSQAFNYFLCIFSGKTFFLFT